VDAKLDFLRELGNIGASHGTTALSKMLHGERLTLVVPEAEMLSFSELGNFIGETEEIVAGIYVRMTGDAEGHMAFILPYPSAVTLANMLTMGSDTELTEIGKSALLEVGNIMITSYINALSALTNLTLYPSVPDIAIDISAAIWQSILVNAEIADQVTLIKTIFTTPNKIELSGRIIFLPTEAGFAKIAEVLGLEEF